VHSQTPSNDNCVVPCSALKNALKVKVQYDYCYNQLSVTRDSILLLDSISHQKDTIIFNKNKEIIVQVNKIATEHEQRANFYKGEADKQKRLKNISIGGGILGVLLSILFL
jgi:superfamily II DNA/RNA helicase